MSAVKIAVIESERGWGQKIDDYMVCLSIEDAKVFADEFNAKNNEKTVPDWYMYADKQDIRAIDLNVAQLKLLKKKKRMWYSSLKTKKI